MFVALQIDMKSIKNKSNPDVVIKFQTKQESKDEALQEFLALSGHKRFMRFVQWQITSKMLFHTGQEQDTSDSFVLTRPSDET